MENYKEAKEKYFHFLCLITICLHGNTRCCTYKKRKHKEEKLIMEKCLLLFRFLSCVCVIQTHSFISLIEFYFSCFLHRTAYKRKVINLSDKNNLFFFYFILLEKNQSSKEL